MAEDPTDGPLSPVKAEENGVTGLKAASAAIENGFQAPLVWKWGGEARLGTRAHLFMGR